jgi:hypothetical protein
MATKLSRMAIVEFYGEMAIPLDKVHLYVELLQYMTPIRQDYSTKVFTVSESGRMNIRILNTTETNQLIMETNIIHTDVVETK